LDIGYIGLGAMGRALSRRLVDRHSLTVWDLDPSAVDRLVALGASPAATAAEVGRKSDIVFLCLPRSSDVRKVLFRENGLAEALTSGKMVIDQTSGVPSETRSFAETLAAQEIALLDAPVAGGVPAVASGSITIMVSGQRQHYERALGVLMDVSPKVFFCGERVGDGQATKLINNSVNSGYRIATLEIAALASKLDFSLRATTDVITHSWANNFTALRLFGSLLRDQASTDFALALMLKDVNQAIALGLDCNAPMPIAGVVRGLMQIGSNAKGPGASLDAIVEVVEGMASARLKGLDAASGVEERLAAQSVGTRIVGLVPSSEVPDEFVGEFAGHPSARVLDANFLDLEALPEVIVDFTRRPVAAHRRNAVELSHRGVALLDATLACPPSASGRQAQAVFFGGSEAAFRICRPLFDATGRHPIYCGSEGAGEIARIVANSVAACNRAIVYENAAVGVKFGLDPSRMGPALNEGSGWSAEGAGILAELESGAATTAAALDSVTDDLRALLSLAMDHGAPVLVAAQVLAMHEAQKHTSGPGATLDALKSRFEASAGIEFAELAG
jgi:3-hydroxyisobutyrate dehydrogenase